MRILSSSLAVVFLLAAFPLWSEEKKEVDACEPHRLEFCKDRPTDSLNVHRCLMQNKSNLSQQCLDQMSKLRSEKDAIKTCFEEVSQFCTNYEGRSRRLNCVYDNYDKLPEGCKLELEKDMNWRYHLQHRCDFKGDTGLKGVTCEKYQ